MIGEEAVISVANHDQTGIRKTASCLPPEEPEGMSVTSAKSLSSFIQTNLVFRITAIYLYFQL